MWKPVLISRTIIFFISRCSFISKNMKAILILCLYFGDARSVKFTTQERYRKHEELIEKIETETKENPKMIFVEMVFSLNKKTGSDTLTIYFKL